MVKEQIVEMGSMKLVNALIFAGDEAYSNKVGILGFGRYFHDCTRLRHFNCNECLNILRIILARKIQNRCQKFRITYHFLCYLNLYFFAISLCFCVVHQKSADLLVEKIKCSAQELCAIGAEIERERERGTKFLLF